LRSEFKPKSDLLQENDTFRKCALVAVYKRRPIREGGGLSTADIFRTRRKGGFFRCARPHL